MNGSIPAQGAHLVFEFERGMALPTKIARGRIAAAGGGDGDGGCST